MSVRGEMGVLREKTNTQGILEATAQTLSLLGKSCNHLELIRLSQAGQRVCPSSGEWNCEGSILYTFCLLHLQVTFFGPFGLTELLTAQPWHLFSQKEGVASS